MGGGGYGGGGTGGGGAGGGGAGGGGTGGGLRGGGRVGGGGVGGGGAGGGGVGGGGEGGGGDGGGGEGDGGGGEGDGGGGTGGGGEGGGGEGGGGEAVHVFVLKLAMMLGKSLALSTPTELAARALWVAPVTSASSVGDESVSHPRYVPGEFPAQLSALVSTSEKAMVPAATLVPTNSCIPVPTQLNGARSRSHPRASSRLMATPRMVVPESLSAVAVVRVRYVARLCRNPGLERSGTPSLTTTITLRPPSLPPPPGKSISLARARPFHIGLYVHPPHGHSRPVGLLTQ